MTGARGRGQAIRLIREGGQAIKNSRAILALVIVAAALCLGASGTLVVTRFKMATGAWTTKAARPTAREGVALAVVNGKIYLIGLNGVDEAKAAEYTPGTTYYVHRKN
jgi:hypothetical protein